ncbi:MAG TPA: response regulator [Puia sp.]|nr:response regulator [Puia sp.]
MYAFDRDNAPSKNDKQCRSILLAEDDIYDQELIIEIIQQIDKRCEVRRATNGLQALNYLEALPLTHLPDLMLLDYNMPLMDAEQLLQHLSIREKYASIPKIVLTSSPPGKAKERCLVFGASDFVIKPEKASAMKTVLKQVFATYGY